jgi:hypothetical protein
LNKLTIDDDINMQLSALNEALCRPKMSWTKGNFHVEQHIKSVFNLVEVMNDEGAQRLYVSGNKTAINEYLNAFLDGIRVGKEFLYKINHRPFERKEIVTNVEKIEKLVNIINSLEYGIKTIQRKTSDGDIMVLCESLIEQIQKARRGSE